MKTGNVIKFFTSKNCAPCKSMVNVLMDAHDKSGTEGFPSFDVMILDTAVPATREQLLEYGVRATPTAIFLKDGKETGRCVGLTATDVFKKMVLREFG